MAIKTIPLSRLKRDLEKTLDECAESGHPNEVDSLMDELLASNPRFQALVAKSKASPRKPFPSGGKS